MPTIEIPPPSGKIPTDSSSAELEKQIQEQKIHNFWTRNVIIVVIIVLLGVIITGFITLGAILQENIARRSATYQDLVNKINEQNVKIDILFNELHQPISKPILEVPLGQ